METFLLSVQESISESTLCWF